LKGLGIGVPSDCIMGVVEEGFDDEFADRDGDEDGEAVEEAQDDVVVSIVDHERNDP
jgi:hypothetical protein